MAARHPPLPAQRLPTNERTAEREERFVNVGPLVVARRRDHSQILIRVSPDAAKDKGEIRLLFGWQNALRQGGN
jgi:hypothetical protein